MTTKTKPVKKTTKEQLQKEIKQLKAQLTDLNRELHDINKWRMAVEDVIGAVEV